MNGTFGTKWSPTGNYAGKKILYLNLPLLLFQFFQMEYSVFPLRPISLSFPPFLSYGSLSCALETIFKYPNYLSEYSNSLMNTQKK